MPRERETWMPNDPYYPFSNGTEHMVWLDNNCSRGERGCRKYRPNASSSRDGCPIEVAVALGYIGDGGVKAKIALRAGWLEPGPNGTLVESEGHNPCIACPEFKGYDEPDDRPRRPPKPPESQLDLLDPRNEPAKERVNA